MTQHRANRYALADKAEAGEIIIVDGKKLKSTQKTNARTSVGRNRCWPALRYRILHSKAKAQAHIDGGAVGCYFGPAGNDLLTLVYTKPHEQIKQKDDNIISASSWYNKLLGSDGKALNDLAPIVRHHVHNPPLLMLLRQWHFRLATEQQKFRLFHGMTTRTLTQARW